MLGYIKAANELRQSYQSQLSSKWQGEDFDGSMPGNFPDADIVRGGDEEMLLFPSYARRHVPTLEDQPSQQARAVPGTEVDNAQSGNENADYWRQEWQKYEDANAIVDVDVRGWVYSPQKGPLSRRNRLILAVARRLSGIPPPNASPSHSRESSRAPSVRDKLGEDIMSHEEEAAAREAELLERRGRQEAAAVSRGTYNFAENDSLIDFSPSVSRSTSPARTSTEQNRTDAPSVSGVQKRSSWNNGTQMTQQEIATANEQLMNRLRPFMTMPLANIPITMFFYNDTQSQSKSVYTDESGHFKVRAALNFVPDKIRVLASETLSATEDVHITESHGVSLVSDIDDTIKHSAIASGAKEIFKNTFIRELGDLTVPGVKEWYNKMAEMGVKLHYVSNSPWQLYPLLKTYFSLAGLPPGSFHLKQYSGVLQGIFEPAGERKKASLDRIMQDFPDRQFILVGDSGEADLEVYTDVVLEHPGRVLAVFIRDVTNAEKKDFFSSSTTAPRTNTRPDARQNDARKTDTGPNLPPRPTSQASNNLIDLSEEAKEQSTKDTKPYSLDLSQLRLDERSTPPSKPVKPSNLRSYSSTASSNSSSDSTVRDGATRKPPQPPAPRRTATSSTTHSQSSDEGQARSHAQHRIRRPGLHSRSSSMRSVPQDIAPQDQGYLAAARHQLNSAYNALPVIRSQSPARSEGSSASTRRGLSSYPAAAAKWVTGATGGDPSAGGDGGAPGAPYDKKLEMWKRRWARSEDIMRRNGVLLRTWRRGEDVMNECREIVEKAQRGVENK